MAEFLQPKLFFGKFAKKFPQQIENRKKGDEVFFAGGKEEDGWYVDIEEGDFVFPIYGGRVPYLLQAKGFANKEENKGINPEGAMYFEVIEEFIPTVQVSNEFQRYRHFNLDLNLLNKSMKQTKSVSFFRIDQADSCPEPTAIDFKNKRAIYIATESVANGIEWKKRDLWVEIDTTDWSIKAIKRWAGEDWESSVGLWNLYEIKNPENPRYKLGQLLDYAKLDGASRKERYLEAVLEQLKRGKAFQVSSPVRLYDNILVGRKVYFPKGRSAQQLETANPQAENIEAPDELDNYTEHIQLLKDCPNLILYGPPGTGKTYSAQKIVETFYFNRNQAYRSFETLQKEGLATLITFHQAFSYEEFVEGIRPTLHTSTADDSDNSDNARSLQYEIRPGVLKNLADKAAPLINAVEIPGFGTPIQAMALQVPVTGSSLSDVSKALLPILQRLATP